MEENKLYKFICNILLDNFAYSLVVDKNHEGIKQLFIKFRDCYDIEPLIEECENAGISIKEGSLNLILNEVRNDLKKVSMELCLLNFSMLERHFFIGERLHLRLSSRKLMDIVKVDDGRWWVMRATQDNSFMQGQFVYIHDIIGPGREINIAEKILRIESVYFFIPNRKSVIVDQIICPGFYSHKFGNSSLEEVLIIPAYRIAEKILSDGEVSFSVWNNYLKKAYKYSFDISTAWHVANAVINNYDILYR